MVSESPASAQGAAAPPADSLDFRRKKQDRFRRHKEKTRTYSNDYSNGAATPEKKKVVPTPDPVVVAPPPTKKPPTRPSRDVLSVTRRRSDGANTGKRDKLLSKLRNKKERFLAPPKSAGQQPDGVNQADSMLSSDGGEQSMHTVDSMMSMDGENSLSRVDSKMSAATHDEADNSNAALETSDTLDISTTGLDDDVGVVETSNADDSEVRSTTTSPDKSVASIDELMGYPMSSNGVRSPKSTPTSPAKSPAKSPMSSTLEQSGTPKMSPRSPEKSTGQEVPATASSKFSLDMEQTEESVDELMGSPRSASPESMKSSKEVYPRSASKAMTSSKEESPRSASKSMTSPKEESVGDFHSPRSPDKLTITEHEAEVSQDASPTSPLAGHLHVSTSNDEGPADELMASPKTPLSKSSPKSTVSRDGSLTEVQSLVSPDQSAGTDMIEAGQRLSPNSQTRSEQFEEMPDDELMASQSKSTPEEAKSGSVSLAVVQDDVVTSSEETVDELMGSPKSAVSNKSSKSNSQQGVDNQVETSAFEESIDKDAEEHEGGNSPVDQQSSVERVATSPREQLGEPSSDHIEGVTGTQSESFLEELDESSSTEPGQTGDMTAQTVVDGPNLNADIGAPPPLPKERRSRSSRKENIAAGKAALETIEGFALEKSRTPPPPPPPKRRGSSKGKQGSPAASKVNLQVITESSPGDANVEPEVGTPPPPPPPKSLGSRRRRRAAANASNKGDESDKDSPVKSGLSQSNEAVTEKAQLQVDTNLSAAKEPLIEVGTPPPPPPVEKSGSKKKRRSGSQKNRSIDTSLHDGEVKADESDAPLEELKPTVEIQKTVRKVAKEDTPFDEVSESAATDTLAIQLAAAKIVERQLSPASEMKPGSFDEIDMPMAMHHKARPFDEVSASDAPNVTPIEVAAGELVARHLPPAPENKSMPFDELSSSHAVDNLPTKIAAAKLVGSHLSPTSEKEIASFVEMQVSSPPISSPREAESSKVSSPSTDSIDEDEAPEMSRLSTNSISIDKNEASEMSSPSTNSIDDPGAEPEPQETPEMTSPSTDSIDEAAASTIINSSMKSVDEIKSPMAAITPSRDVEVVEMARAVLARKREARSRDIETHEDSSKVIESDDQELQYLAKVFIVDSKDPIEQEDSPLVEKDSDLAAVTVVLPNPNMLEGPAHEESPSSDSVKHGSIEEPPSPSSPVDGFDEEGKSDTAVQSATDEETQATHEESELVDAQSSEYETFNFMVSKESGDGEVSNVLDAEGEDTASFNFMVSKESGVGEVSNVLDAEGEDTANVWDTRSILEHPIETPPSAVPDIDSSWDASRMTFTDEKKSQDDFDIFDSVSWSQAGSEFSQSAEAASKSKENLNGLMVGTLESNVPQVDPAVPVSDEVPFAEDVWSSVDASKIKDAAETPVPLSLKEEQALLDDVGRSNLEDDDDEEAGEKLSQVERLELYNNTSYVSSSDDEDIAAVESEHDESCHEESEEEDEEVQYVSHNIEVDSDVEESSESEDVDVRPSGVPAATFGASDMAAKIANQEDKSEVAEAGELLVSNPASSPIASLYEETAIKNDENLQKEISPSTPEVTPPEPLDEDESGNIVSSSTSEQSTSPKTPGFTKAIPLLAPPPEDKLKKWEEQKLRPFKHLEAAKAARENQAADASFAEFPSVVKSPRDFSFVSESVSNERSEDGKIFFNDHKMPEEVARASSVAAEVLEEKVNAEGKGAISNKTSNVDEDTESDIMQDHMSSMLFCGGAATLQENILSKMGVSPFVNCNPGISTEEEPQKEENVATSVFSTWKSHPLLRLASEKIAEANGDLQVGDTRPDIKETTSKSVEEDIPSIPAMIDSDLAIWLQCLVLHSDCKQGQFDDAEAELRALLEDDGNFDRLCALAASKVSTAVMFTREDIQGQTPTSGNKVKEIIPFTLTNGKQRPHVLAANFVSFVQRIGKLTGVSSPFRDENPFLLMLVGESLEGKKEAGAVGSMQQLVFDTAGSEAPQMTRFFYDVVQAATLMTAKSEESSIEVSKDMPLDPLLNTASEKSISLLPKRRYEIPPEGTPSPFETATWSLPSAVAMLLGFLGDPVAVCRMKMVNRFCNRIVAENEQNFMRDAVRLGGISMNVRPAFWLWITLEKSRGENKMNNSLADGLDEEEDTRPAPSDISKLAQQGREGNWHGVIDRDVARAFGNMPPHKTGARFRTDSIVRALVTYGTGRLIKRGVRGGGEAPPIPRIATSEGLLPKSKPRRTSATPPPWFGGDDRSEGSDASETPTDTVSDWGCVSPVGSFASSVGEEAETKRQLSRRDAPSSDVQESITEGEESDVPRHPTEELALSGNTLTNEMKTKLQNQLDCILHALAAEHDDVGYCQGMDYVVAHLLRILQDTVIWQAAKGTLPAAITGTKRLASLLADDSVVLSEETITESLVVEEAVFRVMDCFFTTYNLRHMYWPELRQLKICCRVFELLIQHKLPVLADHFEHHELNVGLFALGWFQTLYLYLPSMPAATVCHMWDIWLVERSFKIFFRVGTAILFLSQPILLNHDLEGMMTYLNTFPDATLLKPDILIACALQIKVTNRMLKELEMEVTGGL